MSENQKEPQYVCHRPDGLEDLGSVGIVKALVCHRPDGLEETQQQLSKPQLVCHRPDGLEV